MPFCRVPVRWRERWQSNPLLCSLSADCPRTEQWAALSVGESHRKWKKLSLALFCVSMATVSYWQVVLIKTSMSILRVLICVGACATVWTSEDKLQEPLFSFHRTGLGHWTPVTRLSGKCAFTCRAVRPSQVIWYTVSRLVQTLFWVTEIISVKTFLQDASPVPGMVVPIYKSSIQEPKARRLLQVQGQPCLLSTIQASQGHIATSSQNKAF